jgi:hypothetical protein
MSQPRRASVRALELVQRQLASDHGRHGHGPLLPCPLCFEPPLGGRRLHDRRGR